MRAVRGLTREKRIEAMLGSIRPRRHGHAQLSQLGRADLDEQRGDGVPSSCQIAQPFGHEVAAGQGAEHVGIHDVDYR